MDLTNGIQWGPGEREEFQSSMEELKQHLADASTEEQKEHIISLINDATKALSLALTLIDKFGKGKLSPAIGKIGQQIIGLIQSLLTLV